MIWPFKTRTKPQDNVFAVYNAIVAQSRQKTFYADWAVPDTVTGRFDMICLHLCLVFRRLRSGGAEGRAFAQSLHDLFFHDMDRSLREMGVGDISVPKRIQKMGTAFYGLLEKITEALETNDEAALTTAIDRNIYGGENAACAERLCSYILDLAARLERQPPETIAAGEIDMGEAP